MTLEQLRIQHFRNLSSVSLAALGPINVVSGDNGSGKTSLLEAIYTLGNARSFRTRKWPSLVQHGEAGFLLSGRVLTPGAGPLTLGVARELSAATPTVRVAGETVRATSELARCLPVQVLDSAGFALLEGPPEKRRQLLDWAVFHVEPQRFVSVWRRYQKALQQRNALLRQGSVSASALEPWTEELIRQGDAMHALRRQQFEAWVPAVESAYAAINGEASAPVDLQLRYYPGWDADTTPLAERLAASEAQDRALGYTRSGPHRADIRVRSGAQAATEVFSRGQLKSVVASFRLGQAILLRQYGIKSVFLVDDLAAELDPQRRASFCRALFALDNQCVFTCIAPDDLAACLAEVAAARLQRFHVKHGQVSPLP